MTRSLRRLPVSVALVAMLALVFVAACGSDDDDATPTPTSAASEAGGPPSTISFTYPFEDFETTPGGVEYVDVVEGDGPAAEAGQLITAHYTGAFLDGRVFDSSVGSQPFTIELGVGRLIKGWDEAIVGMKVGGTRLLYVPSAMAYGESGYGSIPPNTDLLFEVQLLGVQ